MAFDRKVFPTDHFHSEDWHAYECWWMIIGNRKVGCCAFERNVDFGGYEENPSLRGSLYVSTTGILPPFQGKGLGQLMKAWQIAWARNNGFQRIVTNTRKSNRPMTALNKKFGFRIVRTLPRYYENPSDSTVVMELLIESESSRRSG